MSEWTKVTWGDVRTMPENGVTVECHRMLPGKSAEMFTCVKMTGTCRWHQPLFTDRGSDFFGGTGHNPQVQVSLDYRSSDVCTEDHADMPQDEAFSLRLDTMWWRALPPATEIPL